MKFIKQLLATFVCTILLFFGFFIHPSMAKDSTNIVSNFTISARSTHSILGDVRNGMTCKYLSTDRKIHCKYSNSPHQELLADGVLIPTYSRFQPNNPGRINVSNGSTYAFINPETKKYIGSTQLFCRLILQFITTNNEYIWLWYNELRFVNGQQMAMIDLNADGIAEISVSGQWTGKIFGTNKWQPINPASNSYSSEEQTYPLRPTLGKISNQGRYRGCKPNGSKVALLKPLSTDASVNAAVQVWTSENSY